MGRYRFSWPGLVVITAFIAMVRYSANFATLSIMGVVLLIVFLIFYKLEVEVIDHAVDLRLGVGLIYKHIDVSDISVAAAVRNPWWMGWGIRYGLNYTLYNVSGLDAVELTLKGKRRKVRIGTNAPNELANLINQKISSRRNDQNSGLTRTK